MFSTKKHLVPDAEVKVQKVKKIEPVYNLVTLQDSKCDAEVKVQKVKKIEPVVNLVTRPMVHANLKMVTVKRRPAAYVTVPGMKKIDRVLSAEDIDHYIKMKKEHFQQGENKQQHVQKQP